MLNALRTLLRTFLGQTCLCSSGKVLGRQDSELKVCFMLGSKFRNIAFQRHKDHLCGMTKILLTFEHQLWVLAIVVRLSACFIAVYHPPSLSGSAPVVLQYERLTSSVCISKLPADYCSIRTTPRVIAHCPPGIVDTQLHPPLILGGSTNQSNITISASR